MDATQSKPDPQAAPVPTVPGVAVCADPADDQELLKAAARLAVDLNLPFLEKPKARSSELDMLLVVTAQRLEIRVLRGPPAIKGGLPVACALEKLDTTSPPGRSLKQPIIKAVGIKSRKDLPLTVLDATAGWGEDAWLLASMGCRVLAVERNGVMATLLRDGVLRAATASENPAELLGRMHVLKADSKHLLRRLARGAGAETADDLPPELRNFLAPDVVYLDPMFPEHDQRKGAEKKPLRVLRSLVGDDTDQDELLTWAMHAARRRVVVKRPPQAPALGPAGTKPTASIKGKGFRFDIYSTLV